MTNILTQRILVVHNAQLPQVALVQLLRENQLEVFEAHSHHDALEILNREAVLIAIIETELSGMDGFELLREIKSSRGIVQVIMVDDGLYLETLMRAFDEGADDVLLKPLSAESIRPVLSASVLKVRRWQELMWRVHTNREELVNAD